MPDLDRVEHALAWAARYGRARDAWLSAAVAAVTGEVRLAQLWSVGSLGRGGGDDLSDVDLVIVPTLQALTDVGDDPLAVLALPGPLLVRRHRPDNAPRGGAYVAACVEVEALPMWIDVYVWPPATAVLPADAIVLVNRDPATPSRDERGFVELINACSDPTVETVPDDGAAVLLRVCIAGKHLARGNQAAFAYTVRGWDLPVDAATQIGVALRERADAAIDVPDRLRQLVAAWVDLCATLSRARGGP